jgi:hypothetical protein
MKAQFSTSSRILDQYKHVGQAPSGGPVAGVGQGAQLLQVAAAGQQIGQPPGGVRVAGVCAGAQPV